MTHVTKKKKKTVKEELKAFFVPPTDLKRSLGFFVDFPVKDRKSERQGSREE